MEDQNHNKVFQGPYDLSFAVTVGNHTYIPLNIDGNAANHIHGILEVLDDFERHLPELEITSWNLLSEQPSYASRSYVYGIWVNHKPKTATLASLNDRELDKYFKHLLETLARDADIKILPRNVSDPH